MKETWWVVVSLLVLFGLFTVSFMAGWERGEQYSRESFEREAIEHGAAEYDSKTGEWKWKTP